MGALTNLNIDGKKILVNKTWHYLGISLRHYGPEFLSNLASVQCVATGIGDCEYERLTDQKLDNHLFICCLVKDNFSTALDYWREHSSYAADYTFPHPSLNLHMVVLEIPEVFHHALNALRLGKYSKMYTEAELKRLFRPSERGFDPYRVLSHDLSYKYKFEDRVNALNSDKNLHEDTLISIPDDAEFDFNFKPEEEIFNYGCEEGVMPSS